VRIEIHDRELGSTRKPEAVFDRSLRQKSPVERQDSWPTRPSRSTEDGSTTRAKQGRNDFVIEPRAPRCDPFRSRVTDTKLASSAERVLVVEDEPIAERWWAVRRGHRVEAVTNGREASVDRAPQLGPEGTVHGRRRQEI
jgi:hypothetical protein